LTAAGWIPLIKTYTTRAAIAVSVFHFGQSTLRILTNHETVFIVWYPFDWTLSPFYELVNISQVKIPTYKNYTILITPIELSKIKAPRFIRYYRSPRLPNHFFPTTPSNSQARMNDNDKLQNMWKNGLLLELGQYASSFLKE
jgi:hypothetical protein